ncbi:hypothetical protein [Sporichthya polymorpha]|uniref:hypothetical protein n=1 Tax=Sporichthya polymorpha TaxID=35751 RepID=UPI00037796D5|nr:hypothetical protein [Sporichthya polymorpha]
MPADGGLVIAVLLYLDGARDRLPAEHGSIEAYRAAAGVGPEGLDRLREVLLQG